MVFFRACVVYVNSDLTFVYSEYVVCVDLNGRL